MKRKELKDAFIKREKLFGGWISYDHPAIAETFALSGFDFIAIDMAVSYTHLRAHET